MGKLPLHMAAAAGNLEMIRNLLSAGAEINTRDSTGITPLSLASEYANKLTADLLLDKGADSTLENNKPETALDSARKANNQKTVRSLEKRVRTLKHA